MRVELVLFSPIRACRILPAFTNNPLTSPFYSKIHILGSFQNIKVARDAIVSLILGSPPGKVYAGLRTVSSRMRQRAL